MVIRATGGGRKSYVRFLCPGVQMWFENTRSLGHWVGKSDLVVEFKSLAGEWLRRINAKQGVGGKLSLDEEVTKKHVEQKLKALDKTKNCEKLADVLQCECKAKFLKPQRVVQLTPDEEEARGEMTWKCYDLAAV